MMMMMITAKYIIIYIFGKEMSQTTNLTKQIFLKNCKKHLFGPTFFDRLTKTVFVTNSGICLKSTTNGSKVAALSVFLHVCTALNKTNMFQSSLESAVITELDAISINAASRTTQFFHPLISRKQNTLHRAPMSPGPCMQKIIYTRFI